MFVNRLCARDLAGGRELAGWTSELTASGAAGTGPVALAEQGAVSAYRIT